jgi:hypothetical protein
MFYAILNNRLLTRALMIIADATAAAAYAAVLRLQQLGADEINTALCLRGRQPISATRGATLFEQPNCTPTK